MNELLRSIRFVVFDFDGVFTNNKVIVSEDGKESVICDRSDGLGLKMLRELNIGMAIVSTEVNPVVAARAKKLKLECVQGCDEKHDTVSALLKDKGLQFSQVAFVGNDINDLSCLNAVGLPVAVADAYPAVLAVAKVVLVRKGGEGAVREFCELLAQCHAAATKPQRV
jgi:3-deoxy-D-manno-octulosonate 8-phosphate phosphatase (KDO 8-P phosphatase)